MAIYGLGLRPLGPKEVLRNHAQLTSNVELISYLKENDREEMVRYQAIMRISRERVLQICQSRWEYLALLSRMKNRIPYRD
jgi:hypothetical protein